MNSRITTLLIGVYSIKTFFIINKKNYKIIQINNKP